MAKEKVDTLVPIEEQPYLIPKNWMWIRLGSITTNQYGYTAKAVVDIHLPKMLRITDIQESGVNWKDVPNCHIDEEDIKKYRLQENDIVIARIGATTGKSHIIKNPPLSVFASYLIRIRMTTNTLPRYIYMFLQTDLYWKQITELSSGIAQPGVNSSKLETMIFPIAPFSEQQRIVNRIESLFAKLDEAKEKAQAVVDGFEDRRAAILHQAFSGELTRNWRKDNTNIPWQTATWGELITSIEAGKNWNALGRPPQDKEFGVVKVSAVTWGEFNEQESKTCEQQSQWNEKVQIKRGDFLFSRANTIQLVGNCVIVKDISKKLMLSDKILRLKHNDKVVPEYVLYYTRTDLYREQIEQLASGNQDGMRNVSQKNMCLVQLPIPPIEEQKAIVDIVGSLMNENMQAKEVAKQVISQIDTMKKTILARAFRGELGTNDPSEPPADIGVS